MRTELSHQCTDTALITHILQTANGAFIGGIVALVVFVLWTIADDRKPTTKDSRGLTSKVCCVEGKY